MNQDNANDDEIWERLSPMLDDALKQLEEQERLAVFLRFFQKKPMREVGETLGVSEAAAKMRVGRAVERLREFFSKRGVAVGASGLAAVLAANAVQAAPIGLSAANAWLLRQRIAEEDALLMSIPAYRDRMGEKPALIPRLFSAR